MRPHADAGREGQFIALAAPLAFVALLLFCWPVVRSPRLTLFESWAHLFGAWSLVVAALFVAARAIRRTRPRDGARRAPGG